LDKSPGVLARLLQGSEDEFHLRRGIFPANVAVLRADVSEMIGMDEAVFHRSNPTKKADHRRLAA